MKTLTGEDFFQTAHLKVYLGNLVGLSWRIYLAKSRDLSDQTWGFKLTNSRYRLDLTNLILLKHWNLTHKPATNMGCFYGMCVHYAKIRVKGSRGR